MPRPLSTSVMSIADMVSTPGVRGAALFARALTVATRQPDQAVEHLEDAVEAYDRAELAYDVLDARVALAGSLRDAGRTEAARREAELVLREAEQLTGRETEVLRLVGTGLANAEIAAELTLSIRTVERHLSNIYLKIGATGPAARSMAISYGHRNRLF